MRYNSEHKARTRDRVLREAAAAIRADGPERMGVAAVMSRAGLTHGGFYSHFKSKDDLLNNAIDFMFAEAPFRFFADSEGRDPRTVLSEYVDNYLSAEHRSSRERGCPVPILAGELYRMPEEARERFAAAVRRIRESIAGMLERAGVGDAAERTDTAVAEMVGAVSLARVSDDASAERILHAARRSVRFKLDLDGIDMAARSD